ncbi:scavenger receptor class B member 1 isoform X1 [Rousettus aegyptiacus]|uniref:Scavenger receptor class B member 1 n=1 Tax=Rousettus aegyptiacus TaxID=9407 RepID=A0A7J8H7C5_ROUAE|nr:scavenger receptor class B member 1 isoform X1 [Rousettus aegyptiacus]KAF6467642.1 scavenger receptor class B member 1 [Rousettus aegyptiacus]
MGSRSRARWAAGALGCFGLLCAVLGIVMIAAVPSIIKQQILKNVRIDPGSLSFSMWKEIPIPFYFSAYFFDIINPDEILKGEKPQVRERGPYVYREFRHKRNITFNDNDTVSYREYRNFQFQPDMSNGLESDYIVMPNILALGASVMMEDRPMSLKLIMTLIFTTFNQRAFMNRTVGEIMWGYEDPFIQLINKYFPDMFPFKGKFGLFAELNNSDSGLFTVYTGIKNFSRIHLVDKWNGISKVNYWHSDQCNMINGTSGQMWAPFMTPEYSLEFYSPEACRSMKLVYEAQGTFAGIPTYRFKAPDTLFANGTVYPPNEGFCPCLESGVQNVSTCRFNAPLFLSHPHFYNADSVLAQAVLGLDPSEKEHSLFLDIHPVTGIPMNVSVKLQLSLYIKAVKGIGQTGQIKPVVLPLLWFEERGSMEGKTLEMFYTQLVLLPRVMRYAQYVLLAVGCVLLLIPIVYHMRSQGPDSPESQPSPAAQPPPLLSPYAPLLQGPQQ